MQKHDPFKGANEVTKSFFSSRQSRRLNLALPERFDHHIPSIPNHIRTVPNPSQPIHSSKKQQKT